MTEGNPSYIGTDSLESLPLSQESYVNALLNQFSCPVTNNLTNVTDLELPTAQEFPSMVTATNFPGAQEFIPMGEEVNNNLDHATLPLEQLPNLWASIPVPNLSYPNVPEKKSPPSSLPAWETWPGEYSFNVFFNLQENCKGVSWIYSNLKNKLYVKKDVPCPVNFSTSIPMSSDVHIRAMALYSSSSHASDIVTRCVNHSMGEITRGIFEAEHLVRCESSMAHYNVDEVTGRHSVVVPFENPSAGQNFSTYIYKFACFGSCAGGPNRRPLMLVFSLEKGNYIIGRYKIDLRICACPGRDMNNDEKQLIQNFPNKVQVKRKEPANISNATQHAPSKKSKKQGPYCIKVHDKNCYDFLKHMKKYYHIYETLKKDISPQELGLLVYSSLSSSEDEVQS